MLRWRQNRSGSRSADGRSVFNCPATAPASNMMCVLLYGTAAAGTGLGCIVARPGVPCRQGASKPGSVQANPRLHALPTLYTALQHEKMHDQET